MHYKLRISEISQKQRYLLSQNESKLKLKMFICKKIPPVCEITPNITVTVNFDNQNTRTFIYIYHSQSYDQ